MVELSLGVVVTFDINFNSYLSLPGQRGIISNETCCSHMGNDLLKVRRQGAVSLITFDHTKAPIESGYNGQQL